MIMASPSDNQSPHSTHQGDPPAPAPAPSTNLPITTCNWCPRPLEADEAFKTHCENDHKLCNDCVRNVFIRNILQVEPHPPKCCGKRIDRDAIAQGFLDGNLLVAWNEYRPWLRVQSRLPVLCMGDCSEYIDDIFTRDITVTCPHCGYKTCTVCRKRGHPGMLCRERDIIYEVCLL